MNQKMEAGRSSGRRTLKVRVGDGKSRSAASRRWLERQLNDPYVAAARREGLRSRAAYKLIELDERLHLLKKGALVVDLGAAPGGWSQAAAARVGPQGRVVAVDKAPMDALAGVIVLTLDLLDVDGADQVRAALGGAADLVLSDMAPAATGHRQTDHLRNVALCEAALDLAEAVLAPDGGFVAKVLRGGAEGALLARLRRGFRVVRHIKPPASRADSSEIYVVATGFRGAASDPGPD
jgi:23S rRNA (uridine2552-2'-O)-methyltransferase